ncbi:MAG: LysR family transcriptional regulator [Burkholderiaceae bacterium]|nr:MAG: LysR family transcriptional regulator [Burkholderiaceae bacterium]MBE7427777.1 LysR family transcriptional regulator [Ideonella sp.]MCC7287112.1 LysR family transcriptional regulator [Burkholderiaceae bacterium]
MTHSRRNALTPEALGMVDAIARSGSFAAAARELGKVPSALTYSVRQLEDALDVLLFDRSSRQARLTAAGQELLEHGRRVLDEVDALANRVQRVATGWEASLTIAADDVLSRLTLFELVEAFYARRGAALTQLRLRTEVLTGVWEALVTGHADLALGLTSDTGAQVGIEMRPLGEMPFVFAVAPHHPLAAAAEPLSDQEIQRHRAIAVADSAQRLAPATHNLLGGQDVLTVTSMQAKVEAQLRCLGCGFLPEALVRAHVRNGVLVIKQVQRGDPKASLCYAWRADAVSQPRKAPQGLALQWWLQQLDSPATRRALLEHPRNATIDMVSA